MKYLILLISFSAFAQGNHEKNAWHHDVSRGTINEYTTVNNTTTSEFNDSAITRDIAVNSAISNIPTISHVSDHSHTSVGAAVGGYDSEQALAVGLFHMQDNMSYKATLGISGSEQVYGVGIGINLP